jgi:hypothetical protein
MGLHACPAGGPSSCPFEEGGGGSSCGIIRRRRHRLSHASIRILLSSVFAVLLLSGSARAGDPWEFWPELNLYKRLGPTTRLYFVTAYATGKESEFLTLDVAGYFDMTFKPFARDLVYPEDWRTQEDWRNKRYFWIRIGYDHVFKNEGEARSTPEDRGIVAAHGRFYLPAQMLLELRARADLRWIGGDYSTRYRLRGELNRDFKVFGTVANVFLQAECFYDTRYDGWARELYQVGAEVTLTEHFRLEPSVARQVDRLPEESGLYAFAIVARWFY